MLLPYNFPPIPAITSAPAPINATPAEVDDNRPVHADYNLQPMAVHSLEHYVKIIRDNEDERFHVS